ncbi:MAG TPA: acyl-CoA dehydrogenase family protein [Alphaproteobacteria bacterium]|jgi:alkylation response protein AidB-like acyl-CoA dehydrogenase|nr:acyl-CoA dehydrogenase family protein [Alphaproteobacteria bacterium]
MDLHFTAAERAFQQEVRDFIEQNYPSDIQDKVRKGQALPKDGYLRWQRILHKQGWIAPGWPVEYGGPGWNVVQRYIFEEEMARADCPRIIPFGLKMVAPVIMEFGTEAQKARYLPRILSSEDWWCQGYSEPGSGSDLASLSTRAVRNGDHYIVNGTKTWTSFAHFADMMFCLVRTDPSAKPQEGISFLLIDMKSPGVEVQPIVTMDGGADVNMVFLTDVKVPAENLVGEENRGWTCAKFLLGHERLGIAAVGRSKRQLERLREIAAAERSGTGRLLDDGDFSQEIARVEVELQALEFTELRFLMQAAGGGAPGAEASMLKIRGTDIQQEITELTMQAVGYYAMPFVREALEPGWNEDPIGPDYAAPAAPVYFNWRKSSIYGGSNEIQRNIIAKMVLGM